VLNNPWDASPSQPTHLSERRHEPRVACTLPAIVRHITSSGSRISEPARIINFSMANLYLQVNTAVEVGEHLLILFWFDPHPEKTQSQALAVRGTARRVERIPNGTFGVAVHFERHRFV